VTGRAATAIVASVVLLGACTTDRGEPAATPRSPRAPDTAASPVPAEGGGRALAALERLCPNVAPPGGSAVPAEGPTPAYVRAVQREVSDIRGLAFTKPVPVDAATQDELVDGLSESFDASYPIDLYRRRSLAWQTIGVVEPGTEVGEAFRELSSGQVIGYYDTIAEQLVFLGSDDPSPVELVTLAHELTHAVDDQHFGLQALERLGLQCRDDGFDAALGLAEGDATYVMFEYARRALTFEDQLEIGGGSGGLEAAPPFIVRLELWPYTAGLRFVQALIVRGGMDAVNAAFRDPPVTTEQILHPDAYPDDLPQAVDIGNLGRRLGEGWHDLDVQEVGEGWLATMLALRMDRDRADEAAAGWDGGIYRAWADGSRVAVVISTAWDSTDDAADFVSTMTDWISSGDEIGEVRQLDGDRVDVLFASDPDVLTALRSAA
jgi:hypothetical protein